MKINEIFGQILLKISYFLTNLSSKSPKIDLKSSEIQVNSQ